MKKLFSIWALLMFAPIASAVTVPLGQVQYPAAVIAGSTTASGALKTGGMSLVGCQMPSAFTGTSISFQVATSLTGAYQALINAGGTVSYSTAASKYIAINPVDFYGVQFFKIISNASEGSSRSLVCSLKGI